MGKSNVGYNNDNRGVPFATTRIVKMKKGKDEVTEPDVPEQPPVPPEATVSEEDLDRMGVPERDRWLYRNAEALASFKEGLRQAAAGQVVRGIDFSQFADDVIEDE